MGKSFINMAEQETQLKDEPSSSGDEGKTKKTRSLKSTLIAAVTLVITLVLVYYALTYLIGTDFNIDTLLTGEKVTRLP